MSTTPTDFVGWGFPCIKNMKKECKDRLGNTYPSVVEMCKAYDIPYKTYKTRLRANWDLEKRLTTPVRERICDHTGETAISNNGMSMKIIAYRSYYDIDVLFEDGTIIKNKSYDHFTKGKISTKSAYKEKRIGEENLMNCGHVCKIIGYNNSHDICIQFEDGVILEHKYYGDF